ncbi:MAG: preprotein translocase subunit SecA [Oscillospiraceae bacterium]|nr:preprotein translocase subunit SecA [Oscillospiraceae bacterium]MBR2890196.1 preprotein translocase subunit SecA [Oscillospiraceae bacterium]
MGLFDKIFGTRSQREVKKLQPTVDRILSLEGEYAALSEEALRGKTAEFKGRLENGETLDDLLPEAFAAIREAAWRVLGMKPYPVQLIGGIILHQGRIAEMKTGEGKTLVAILPCYLNALTGRGVHVVTVNDYLARRDSEWMGKVYRYMGLTVGLIVPGMMPRERKDAYAADITYCTNNELGFDYLRDNMSIYKEELVQRGHNFAIVDEVDSILVDEARTPLIISGKGEDSSKLYELADHFVSTLRKKVFAKTEDKEVHDDYDCDYFVDEKSRTVSLTASGIAKAERHFGVENLADPDHGELNHHLNQAMKARGLMKKDIDYVVKDGQIIIVDEFTGRLMYGRRYNEGLHQAIEAKEGVKVAGESKTLATITFQNFFRLYNKLSGMTGTALTEEEEFAAIYHLDVVEIPTNRPVIRKDLPDVVYKTEAGKFRAIVRQVKECHAKGQPVLVGTISIEKSEILSKLLKREGIPHNVLNAKYHEMEAQIVAQAGWYGAVTIATNMAGRGTDIMLGGNAEYMAMNDLRKQEIPEELLREANSYAETTDPEILAVRAKYEALLEQYRDQIAQYAEKVRAAGGLCIIGTERHESRRIDNQLRGRAGRQGDPGESRFYLSMEDDLMRLFSADRVMSLMDTLGLDEDTPIDQKILSGAVENAQKSVESRNFRSRKSVLEYDDVMNTQREIIYEQRRKVLDGENLSQTMLNNLRRVVEGLVATVTAELGGISNQEELNALLKRMENIYFPAGAVVLSDEELAAMKPGDLAELLYEKAAQGYALREKAFGETVMRELERVVMLRVVDEYWMDHIDAMDELKQGIGLRAYGQHDPVTEYKEQGYAMFEATVHAIQEETVRRLFLARIRPQQEVKRVKVAKETSAVGTADSIVKPKPVRTAATKVGPNDPCPCGSGKKYKKCCRAKDIAAGKNAE